MLLKYNINIEDSSIVVNLKRLINQVYKLLPIREEGADWRLPLSTILEELSGMDSLLIGQHDILFSLLCKLEGLNSLSEKENFFSYRRTIFECLSLLNDMVKDIECNR